MPKTRNINIDFPFRDSQKGYFLKLNTVDKDAIKADLLHLILTNKGERLYLPDFGTNLKRYLFEPNDGITSDGIRSEITEAVSKYLPNLVINNIEMAPNPEDTEHGVLVTLRYTITEDVFETRDFVTIAL